MVCGGGMEGRQTTEREKDETDVCSAESVLVAFVVSFTRKCHLRGKFKFLPALKIDITLDLHSLVFTGSNSIRF